MVDRCATIAIVADFDIDTGASGRLTEVIGLGVLTRLIDRDTVDEVLAKADRRETRVRLLPARVVVYLVLALCLFAGLPMRAAWRVFCGVPRVPLATHLGRAASPGIRVAFAALRSISKFVSSRLIWA